MRLTLIAGDPDSNPNNSPTLYKTDRGSWVVQGLGHQRRRRARYAQPS